MTHRAYYNGDELTMRTQVLHCSPTEDGKIWVVLAETLLHPQDGGQLSDKGFIASVNVDRVHVEK
jgi:alanyl-tRNA synthetase